MAKANNQWERAAAEAAQRIDAARAVGQQLDLLPAEPDTTGIVGQAGGGRGKGKASAKLRDWLAVKGYRMPEEVLAKIAGLTGPDGAMVEAMQEAEAVLAWAAGKGGTATPAQRLAVFMQLYTAKLRALDALLPYGLAKITPDAAPVQAVQVVVQGGPAPAQPATGPDRARDVTPQAGRLAPPPMPWGMQGNQGVAEGVPMPSDAAIRTEGASD